MKRPAPTFEVSINFWSDPKVIAAGVKAAVLYIRCGCESRRHMTDGVVLLSQIKAQSTDLGDWDKLAKCLVENKLWSRCPGGYRIPLKRWRTWQMTNAQIESTREFERERKRRQRSKREAEPGGNVPVGHGVGHPPGPLSTSTSTSQSTSAGTSPASQRGPLPPDIRLDPPTPRDREAVARKGASAARWSWLAGWSPGPDDNARSVLTRLGVGEPSVSAFVRAKIPIERIVAVATDVHADRRVYNPVGTLVRRLQLEFEEQGAKAKGTPLGADVTRALGNIAQMREQRVNASVGAAAASRQARASPAQESGP